MFFWLVDNAFLLCVLLALAALVFLAAWWQTRRRPFLIGLGTAAALAGLIYTLTLLIETDRQKIERSLRTMAAGMQEQPPRKLIALISKKFRGTFVRRGNRETWDYKQICDRAIQGQKVFQITDITIQDIDIKNIADGEATVFFAARPVPPMQIHFFPFEALFVREEDGVWRVRTLKMFDPDKPDQLFDIPM